MNASILNNLYLQMYMKGFVEAFWEKRTISVELYYNLHGMGPTSWIFAKSIYFLSKILSGK